MKKRGLYLSLLIGFGLLLCLVVLAALGYFFSLGYDVPFRIAGHAEKNLYLRDRPFALSPSGTRLVFASLETGNGDLYTMDADGQHIQRLTSASEYESAPCFSADGRWLLFCRKTNKCGHIWRMAADGTDAKQLTFGPDYDTNPRYAADGKHISFERTPLGTYPEGYYVLTMTTEGHNLTLLPSDGSKQPESHTRDGNKHWFACSSDGREVFFLEETSHGAYICRDAVHGSDYHRLCKPTTWVE